TGHRSYNCLVTYSIDQSGRILLIKAKIVVNRKSQSEETFVRNYCRQRPGFSAVLVFRVTAARYCRWVKVES
ncbi:MAG: hypothetical protein ACHQ1D_06930, partial [Nitrososphaerales archaeon]